MKPAIATPPRASIIVVTSGRGEGLLARLQALHETLGGRQSYEFVVVLGSLGRSTGDALRRALDCVTVVQTEATLGVPAGCNLGARAAGGEYLILLDEHTEAEPGWLDWLIHTADGNPDAGAVGSCVLFPDGRLRNAGSVVWWDGRTTSVGDGSAGAALTWRFVRRVDVASAVSLLVKRVVWERLGGFDETYAPGVYHDVDLCLRIRSQGQHVLLEPRSRVRHFDSTLSSDDFDAFVRDQLRLALLARWKPDLQAHGPWSPTAIKPAIHRARGYPRRVLLVDDFIPDPAAGAGFGRMFCAVVELAQAGYAVSHHPTRGASPPADALVDCGMSIIEGDLAAHLQRPDTWYDVVVVSRPHNFDYVWPAVRTHQPWAQLIYDCEAMWWRRLARQAELTTDPEAAGRLRAEAALMQTIEVRNVRASDVVVTVSEDESSLVRQIGVDERNVFALAPIESGVSPTTHGFHARRDIGLVAGWMAGLASPNADGLHWFIDHVLPVIRSRIPWVRLRVTGRNPPVELLSMSDPNLSFEGHVSDLARFYEQVRVVVSPMRFGSGVKLKTVQAIQYAVPTVATSIGAEGLTLASSAGLYVSDDPSVFADAVTRLLTDEHEWERSRAALFTCIEAWSSARATESWPRLVNELSARRVNGSDATSARH